MALDIRRAVLAALQSALEDEEPQEPRRRKRLSGVGSVVLGATLVTAARVAAKQVNFGTVARAMAARGTRFLEGQASGLLPNRDNLRAAEVKEELPEEDYSGEDLEGEDYDDQAEAEEYEEPQEYEEPEAADEEEPEDEESEEPEAADEEEPEAEEDEEYEEYEEPGAEDEEEPLAADEEE